MKTQILIATLLSLTAATAASLAVAKPGAGREGQHPTFEQLDADSDGQLSTAEIEAAGEMRFRTMDADGDGALTVEELIAHQQVRAEQRISRMMERFDANGDGQLSFEELPKRPGLQRLLQKADTDGNGSISKAEFDTAQAILQSVMHSHRHHEGHGDHEGHGAHGGHEGWGHEMRGHGRDTE